MYACPLAASPSHIYSTASTAFQRMKMIWLVVWPLAINAISKTQTQWNDTSHILTFSDSRCAPHYIRLDGFRAFAYSLVADAQKGLEELLLTDIPVSELLGAIDLKQLKDKPDSQSSFLQQNKKIFEPLIEEVFQSLTSTQACDSKGGCKKQILFTSPKDLIHQGTGPPLINSLRIFLDLWNSAERVSGCRTEVCILGEWQMQCLHNERLSHLRLATIKSF